MYAGVARGNYFLGDVARWSLNQLAEMTLAVGLAPVAALVIVAGLAVAQPATITVHQRSFVAVAIAAILAFSLEVGLFVSGFSHRFEERYTFHVEPPLLLALAVWLANGLPRPPRLTVAAAVVPALLLVGLPLERATDLGNISEAPGLVGITHIAYRLPTSFEDVRVAALLVGFIVMLVFSAASTRLWLTVPAVLAAYFLCASHVVFDTQRAFAYALESGAGATGKLTWIDKAVGRDTKVTAVYVGEPDPTRVSWVYLLAYTWNRSVGSVQKLSPLPICCVPQGDANVDPGTGRITSQNLARHPPDYVVSDIPIAGETVASGNQLTLYRVAPPLRLVSRKQGIYPDGWMGGSAAVTQYSTPGNRPGFIRVSLSRTAWHGTDVPGRVIIRVRRVGVAPGHLFAERRWTIHSGSKGEFRLPTPRPPFRVEITVDPTFSPADFAFADTRQLGAQVDFSLELEPDDNG